MKKPFQILGIGEVLWDVFPDKKVLGGAPANFVYHLVQLGADARIISRIGSDQSGRELINRLRERQVDTNLLQIDDVHPTGQVRVRLDSAGVPDYEIVTSVAWDFLEIDDDWLNLVTQTDLIAFGTLAQRSSRSRQAIISFLEQAPDSVIRLCDLNIRQKFYSIEIIEKSLELANILKLNHDELALLARLFSLSGKDEDACRDLCERFGLDMVAVTMGAAGCLVVTPDECHREYGIAVNVVDTVGSGDAFAAAMVFCLLSGMSISVIGNRANFLGAYVASQAGGMPDIGEKVKAKIFQD